LDAVLEDGTEILVGSERIFLVLVYVYVAGSPFVLLLVLELNLLPGTLLFRSFVIAVATEAEADPGLERGFTETLGPLCDLLR